MKVALVTEYGENYRGIANVTIPVMQAYCDKHGYLLHQITLEDGNDYAYKKHEYFQGLMQTDVDLIAYFDADVLLTNHAIKIESFVSDEENKVLFITQDFNELNGGAIILKNNELGRMLNDLILKERFHYENEQNCINDLIKFQGVNYLIQILPHPSINSLKYSLYPECTEYVGREDLGDWRVGNFALHVPALGLNRRIEVLKNHVCHIRP